jgi:hypothetical protein
VPDKVRLLAPCDPRDRNTYIYSPHQQKEYYQQYGESYFGYTRRQGGWDCMRHYEILAAGSVPYFQDIEQCPAGTLPFIPRDNLMTARTLHDNWTDCQSDLDSYKKVHSSLRFALLNYLTTEALAKYVLGKLL